MDPTSRGWKLLNLAVGDSEKNNNTRGVIIFLVDETPNIIEFVVAFDDEKSV